MILLTAIDVAGRKNSVTSVMIFIEIASCCVLFATCSMFLVIFSISMADWRLWSILRY
jgi:hypothetical protein